MNEAVFPMEHGEFSSLSCCHVSFQGCSPWKSIGLKRLLSFWDDGNSPGGYVENSKADEFCGR